MGQFFGEQALFYLILGYKAEVVVSHGGGGDTARGVDVAIGEIDFPDGFKDRFAGSHVTRLQQEHKVVLPKARGIALGFRPT